MSNKAIKILALAVIGAVFTGLLVSLFVIGFGINDLFKEFSGQKSSEFGFIDKTGKLVIQKKFSDVGQFSEGFAGAAEPFLSDTTAIGALTQTKSWGFIDRSGNYVIKPQFSNVLGFSEKLAAVQFVVDKYAPQNSYGYSPGMGSYVQGRKWGFIDTAGRTVIPAEFDAVGSFNGNLAPAKKEGKGWGYINRSGQFVIDPRFEDAFAFAGDLAVAAENGRYGYIDRSGKFVIAPQFNSANPFSNGFATVGSASRRGVIDRNGKYVIGPGKLQVLKLSEGLAPVGSNFSVDPKYDVRSEKFLVKSVGDYIAFEPGEYDDQIPSIGGYIDATGKVVVKPEQIDVNGYFKLGNFHDGLATCEGGKIIVRTGYIDKSGKTVIPLEYQTARAFSEGLAAVGYMPSVVSF